MHRHWFVLFPYGRGEIVEIWESFNTAWQKHLLPKRMCYGAHYPTVAAFLGIFMDHITCLPPTLGGGPVLE